MDRKEAHVSYGYNGWTPPPAPGLVPLRPMGFGTLLGAPFNTLRRNPRATFGSGLLIQLATLVGTAAIFVPLIVWSVTRIDSANSSDIDVIAAGSIALVVLAALVSVVISIAANAFLQGVMITEVSRAMIGEKPRMGQLWRAARSRFWPLAGWSAMIALVLGVLVVGLVVGIVAVSVVLGPIGLMAAILGGLFIAAACAVLLVWLGTKLAIVPSAIVLERQGIRAAMKRSWQLTDGHFWRTFGIIALVAVILYIASQVVVQPITLVMSMLIPLIDPTGVGAESGALIPVVIVLYLVMIVVTIVVGAVSAVAQSALLGLIYIDLRMRKEGLDLDLQRAAEAAAFSASVPDPYVIAQARAHA